MTFLLYVAIPGATLIIGAILGAALMVGIDRGSVATIDDRSFEDQWRDEIAETPFAPADEAHVQEALELVRPVRPKPYPPLKSVPDA